MTLADKVFGGSPHSPASRYVASWCSSAIFAAVAVGVWFLPADDFEEPVGRWGVSLLCGAMAAFAWWGNRHIRAEMRAGSVNGERDSGSGDSG